MRPVLIYRTRYSRPFALIVWIVCVVVSVQAVIQSAATASSLMLWAAAVAALVWLALWRPSAEIADSGVTLRGVFSDVHVSWPAFTGATSQWALTVSDAHRNYSSWAIPAPSGTRQRFRARRRRSTRTEASDEMDPGGRQRRATDPEVTPNRDGTAAVLRRHGNADDVVELIEARLNHLRIGGFLSGPTEGLRGDRSLNTFPLLATVALVAAALIFGG